MREKGVKDDLNGGWTDTGRAKAGACLRSKHKFGFGIWSLRCPLDILVATLLGTQGRDLSQS